MEINRSVSMAILVMVAGTVHAQQVIVNTVGKDPFVGKTTEVVYKAKEGTWTFQGFNNAVIKTTYKPADYNKTEQITDAVIAKPPAVGTKVTVAVSQTVEWDNLTSVVVQREKFYYKTGKEVKVKSASYFAQGDTRGFKFQLFDNEQIFGGGERAVAMNRRGRRFNLYNSTAPDYGLGSENLNFSVPFFISSAGYGLFFDNASRGYADIGLTDKNVLEAGFSSGELTYYVVFGKNLDEIMANYSSITGRQPLPPRWVFGNFVSGAGANSEEQVKKAVGTVKQDNFPLDGWLFDQGWLGDKAQTSPAFPQLLADLKKKESVKPVLITEPYTKNSPEATPLLATGADGLPDIFRRQAQDFIWKQYKKQVGNGVSGWWLQQAEPDKHPAGAQHNLKDYGVARPMGAEEVHNAYGHYFSKMFFEKYASDAGDQRLVLFSNAGFAGSQRYGVLPYSGKVAHSWSGLKSQPLVLLGMSLGGMPYIHTDAGGEWSDPELYTRWLQMAAFTPVFHPSLAMLSEPHKSIVRNYIHLRYQLLPYNYSMCYDQVVGGKPLMRPLYYYSFADSVALKAEDAYLWGDNILVAPVTSQGATARMVYLPAGKWYSLANNSVTDGGKFVNQPSDIKQIPVFVREGGFVPLWLSKDTIRSTDAFDSKNITIRYYPSTYASQYAWFDDDGSSAKTLERADYEVVTFKGITAGNKVTIDITTNNPNQYGKKFKRTFKFELPVALAGQASVNGKPVEAGSFGKQLDPFQQLSNEFLTVEFNGKPVKVEITLK